MERLPVYRGAECVGTLEAEQEGLYWRLSAVCRGEPLERLWLYTAGHRHCLGPLEPEHGLMACRGRVSRAALGGERITHAAVHPAGQQWERCGSRTLFGQTFRDVLCDGALTAVPFDPEGPFPLPGQFCLCRVERIDQRWYVVLSEVGGVVK